MRTLNLGILAHVDAGKTTLTERLLFEAGAISKIGSVDRGTTQTDTLELERERGITIKSAVASFAIGDLTVNILDTPGHPDFIAEVERVLQRPRRRDPGHLGGRGGAAPDAAAVQGALQRLGVPTLLFLNKIDRAGRSRNGPSTSIGQRLSPASCRCAGRPTRDARCRHRAGRTRRTTASRRWSSSRLAERDEACSPPTSRPDPAVAAPVRRDCRAIAGRAGSIRSSWARPSADRASPSSRGIPELLPEASDEVRGRGPRAGLQDRAVTGRRSGRLRAHCSRAPSMRATGSRTATATKGAITALATTNPGGAAQAQAVGAGQIAKIGGLGGRAGRRPDRRGHGHRGGAPIPAAGARVGRQADPRVRGAGGFEPP